MLPDIDTTDASERARLARIGVCFGMQATEAAQRLLPLLREHEPSLAAHGFTSGGCVKLEALLSLSAVQPRERAILHAMRRDMCESCTRCVREALALCEALGGADPWDVDPASLWPLLDALAAQLTASQDPRAPQALALSRSLRAHLHERTKMRELPVAVDRWDMIEGAIFDLLRAAQRAAAAAAAAGDADPALSALNPLALLQVGGASG
jgi:hypothetical protein